MELQMMKVLLVQDTQGAGHEGLQGQQNVIPT